MPIDTNLLMIALAGLLVGLASWGILYGLLTLFGGRDARVRARIKHFVTQEDRAPINPAQQGRQLRENLFAQIDSRWRDRSFFQSIFRGIIRDIEKADLKITPTELVLSQLGVSIGLALVMWLLVPAYGPIAAALGLVLGFLIARSYLRYLGRRRIRQFEEQLPDALSILATSVKGGFSLFQALQLIAREAQEPSKTEFMRVIHEVSLGAKMDDALAGLARRMPTEDVDILVTVIALQQQTGGSLAHVLDVVAGTVRERHRVEREISSMTAQQRLSAILLAALPYILALVIFVISPTYIGHMFVWGWVLCMPVGAVILSVIGLVIMRRIAAIDV
jgi:tight adherence protein B